MEEINEIIETAKAVDRLMREGKVRNFTRSCGRPAVRLRKVRFDALLPNCRPAKRWQTYGIEKNGVWLYYDADERG